MISVKVTSHCKELYEMHMAVDLDVSSRSGSEKQPLFDMGEKR